MLAADSMLSLLGAKIGIRVYIRRTLTDLNINNIVVVDIEFIVGSPQ